MLQHYSTIAVIFSLEFLSAFYFLKMFKKTELLTSKFNIQQYVQNTTQKARRFSKNSTQLLWEILYESSGKEDQQNGI